MRNLKLTLFVVVLIVSWLDGFNAAQAQIITSVSRGGSSTKPPPIIAPNSLTEDELCFVDRTHQYNDIPTTLLRAEYVMIANDDKEQADFSLNVTLSQPARVYLFLDNRLGHGATHGADPNMNPELWSAGMDWVYTKGYTDTGMNIGIDEGGDGHINQWASVYLKETQAGTVTLLQQNDLTNPTDRNMYGVAALKSKLFKSSWFDTGKLYLVHTPGPLTVSAGFHAGPNWFWDDHKWRSPFEFEDDHDWRSPFEGNSWGVSKWRSPLEGNSPFGGDIWSFVTNLELQYTDPNVCPIHRWFFLWDKGPNGQGNCMEVTTGDVGISSPLPSGIIDDNLVIQNHTCIVNTKIRSVFSDLEFIPINTLEEYVRERMPEEDVRTFLDGVIWDHWKITDPCGQGQVGVQFASWDHPPTPVLLSAESLEVEVTDGIISYEVSLPEPPVNPVTVHLKKIGPAIKWADYDDDVNPTLVFDPRNYKPQVVRIAVDDGWSTLYSIAANVYDVKWGKQGYQTTVGNPAGDRFFDTWVSHGRIAHYMDSDPTEIALLPVTVMDKREYAPTDINRDTITNLVDVSYVANNFLLSTEQPQVIDPFTNADEFTGVDIGTTGGSAEYDPGEKIWTVTGDGADIWGTSDHFHYVYQDVGDMDFQMTATVLGLEYTHEWAKAGIMLRDELDPDSAYSMIAVTPGRGLVFQVRYKSREISESINGGTLAHLKDPISLRLVAKGHTVTGYYYADGMWIKLGATSDDCKCYGADNAGHIGLAVTSHVDGVLTTATFGSDLVSVLPVPTP